MTIRVLSLFDGVSGAKQALKELNIDCFYFASEIDKWAIQVAKANHPDIEHIGDVRAVRSFGYEAGMRHCQITGRTMNWVSESNIDLLIGGSPCQDLSIANKERKGLQGERSGLFYEYLRILNDTRPKYFVLENVASMSKAAKETITKELFGIEPVMINSALVTAQNRKRLYWVGKLVDGKYEQVKIEQPEDQKIYLKDIIEDLPDCPIGIKVREKSKCIRVGGRNSPFGSKQEWDSPFQRVSKKGIVKKGIEKASCLTGGGNSGGNHSDMDLIHSPFATRRYSETECCRLQGFPDNHVSMVSKTQGYKALGNGFTVPVIKHILKNILT